MRRTRAPGFGAAGFAALDLSRSIFRQAHRACRANRPAALLAPRTSRRRSARSPTHATRLFATNGTGGTKRRIEAQATGWSKSPSYRWTRCRSSKHCTEDRRFIEWHRHLMESDLINLTTGKWSLFGRTEITWILFELIEAAIAEGAMANHWPGAPKGARPDRAAAAQARGNAARPRRGAARN